MLNKQALEMEISPTTLIRHWGTNRRQITMDVLERIKIPTASKLYLADVGLPYTWIELEFDFQSDKFLTLAELVELAQPANQMGSRPPHPLDLTQYYYLGKNEFSALCVEEITGAVFLVDIPGFPATNRTDATEKTFVNSNVQLLGEFIYLYEVAVRQAEAGKLTPQKVISLNEKFKRMDSRAMENLDIGLWPTNVEEMLEVTLEEDEDMEVEEQEIWWNQLYGTKTHT
jgi:hypothetical protein